MDLKVYDNYEAMSQAAAEAIVGMIKRKPGALICFASGDTPKRTYQLAAEKIKQGKVDFSRCTFLGLDEWLGIPPGNTGSCHYFLQHYLFLPLGAGPGQVFLFDGLTKNENAECERINKLVEEKGGIDLAVVGVGMNGHIGFNEPGTEEGSGAHVAVLDDTTKTVGKKYFEREAPIGKGITVGLKQLMGAGILLMIANGKKKAPVIKKCMEDEIGTHFPATLMRKHANGILVIDQDAASELKTNVK